MKLNLCCGTKAKQGYINTDIINFEGVDIVMDANKIPYQFEDNPFEDNYFDEIYIRNSIEHLFIDLDIIMKELHRILKKGGKLIIITCHYTNPSAYLTQHKKQFGARTLEGYVKGGGMNICYDFEFESIKIKISFVRGLASIYNYFVGKIANINISKYYEGTPLSLFPAKTIEYELIK